VAPGSYAPRLPQRATAARRRSSDGGGGSSLVHSLLLPAPSPRRQASATRRRQCGDGAASLPLLSLPEWLGWRAKIRARRHIRALRACATTLDLASGPDERDVTYALGCPGAGEKRQTRTLLSCSARFRLVALGAVKRALRDGRVCVCCFSPAPGHPKAYGTSRSSSPDAKSSVVAHARYADVAPGPGFRAPTQPPGEGEKGEGSCTVAAALPSGRRCLPAGGGGGGPPSREWTKLEPPPPSELRLRAAVARRGRRGAEDPGATLASSASS
jgi:hypothetical protein